MRDINGEQIAMESFDISRYHFKMCPFGEEYMGSACQCDKCCHDRQQKERMHELNNSYFLRGLGVAEEHDHATIKNFNGECHGVAQYIKKYDGFLLLLSPAPGNGKTHMAVGVMKRYMYVNPFAVGRLVNWYDVTSEMGDKSYGGPARSEFKLLTEMKLPDILVIDDLGGKVTDAIRTELYIVVNHRWMRKKPTIITSNLSIERIAAEYGAKIADRLKCGTMQIFSGNSNRK
jgi:DNA replication protein DnaC